MIGPLTLYVLNSALQQCRMWKEAGLDLTVSVNLSVRNLLDVELPENIDPRGHRTAPVPPRITS